MKTDVYIKNEGYADIRLKSDKIKKFAYEQGFENDLEMFDSWGGEPIWSPETQVGAFKASVDGSAGVEVTKLFESAGFNVESEFRSR